MCVETVKAKCQAAGDLLREIAKKNAQIFQVENQVKFLLADAEKLPQSSQVYNFIYY